MLEKILNIPIFQGTDASILENLYATGGITKHTYSKGVTVHEQGTPCTKIEIVINGSLVAYSLGSNGSETIVFTFNENDVIGANLLFGNNNKYPMNIYTTCNCILISLEKPIIVELLKDHKFALKFVHSLSLNSQGLNQKFAMHMQKSLRQNILDYLEALSLEQDSNPVLLPISKKQLADYLGVQRPSLFRELKRLKDDGLLIIDNKRIFLNKENCLKV